MCTEQRTLETVAKFKSEIATFANCSKVELADTSSMPTGCAILSVSDKCQVHLLLKVNYFKNLAQNMHFIKKYLKYNF
jgi:valyl-tRNA synthetase